MYRVIDRAIYVICCVIYTVVYHDMPCVMFRAIHRVSYIVINRVRYLDLYIVMFFIL